MTTHLPFREHIRALHESGALFRLRMRIATRLADYAIEADRFGLLYSGGVVMSDNTLFHLLKHDATEEIPGLPPGIFRKVVGATLAHVRKEAARLCEGDERVPVIISDEPLDELVTMS